ncbi:DNA-3-methyladenine glycosylase II [Paenibacillus shirakamiensis]|uniref:DNA-3-methyladenine glycosylase II n=1 Tax=Paenibacillus shirakamiensis TaxID=1265935 RepID=A0ABS4JJZ8_9BACL|nr:DNA-3-methyladenine glycosylase 2 family protein [Paenibacillus shirakamiensis]MBP2002033.1 DNA-3-methyladenine glycosylase II [Paenibacillus shirakamiensis]
MATVVTKLFKYDLEAIAHLKHVDEAMRAVIERIGMPERIIMPDLFSALIYAIIGQLISVKAAQTIWGRLQDRVEHITPEHLALLTPEAIQQLGMTMKKARSIHEVSCLIAQGDFSIQALDSLSDNEVIQRLSSLRGIGVWTAEMLLIHSLERPNVLSWGDIAIRRGVMRLYGLETLSKSQFEEYRALYAPYGTVASIYLWELS